MWDNDGAGLTVNGEDSTVSVFSSLLGKNKTSDAIMHTEDGAMIQAFNAIDPSFEPYDAVSLDFRVPASSEQATAGRYNEPVGPHGIAPFEGGTHETFEQVQVFSTTPNCCAPARPMRRSPSALTSR